MYDRRQSGGERQDIDAHPIGDYKRVAHDVKCVQPALEAVEGRRDIFHSPNFQCDGLKAEPAGCCFSLAHLDRGSRTADIGHDPQPAKIGENLAQHFEALASHIGLLERQAGDVAARLRESSRPSRCRPGPPL